MCDEPSPRFGHILASVGPKSFLWAGQGDDFANKEERKQFASVVYVFDHATKKWCQHGLNNSIADFPPGLKAGGFAVSGNEVFSFGERDDAGAHQHKSLHIDLLDTIWLEWHIVPIINASQGPMPKSGCEIVVTDRKLCLFGGYGTPGETLQPDSKYDRDEEDAYSKGHTNEFHFYDLTQAWLTIIVTADEIMDGI